MSNMATLNPETVSMSDGLRGRPGTRGGIKDFFLKLVANSRSSGNLTKSDGENKSPRALDHGKDKTKVNYLKAECQSGRPRALSDASEKSRPKYVGSFGTAAKKSVNDARLRKDGNNSVGSQETLKHPGVSMLRQPRSTAMTIGPNEFVDIYRARASSEPRNDARLQALANIRTRQSLTPAPNGKLGLEPYRSSPLCGRIGGYGETEKPHLIIWRDKATGTKVFQLPRIQLNGEDDEVIDLSANDVKMESLGECVMEMDPDKEAQLKDNKDSVYASLLKACRCYDVIPVTNKVILLDSQLVARKALFALLDNGVRAAPIWDAEKGALVGMLTVTDFIRVIQRYRQERPGEMDNIENETLSTFTSMSHPSSSPSGNNLIFVSPDCSLYDAAAIFQRRVVRRLPIIDVTSGDVLHILTMSSILKMIYRAFTELDPPAFMLRSIFELGVGTYKGILTAKQDSPLLDVLNVLVQRQISSLPIVDAEGRLVALYSKAYAIDLALENMNVITDMTVEQALDKILNSQSSEVKESSHADTDLTYTVVGRQNKNSGLPTCRKENTLSDVFAKMVISNADCLVVTNVAGRVEGIVTQSDLLSFLARDRRLAVQTARRHLESC